MTTGAPLYLVSACGTADEFVAAFRRYADRTGLFVPVATPLPTGRRVRIALTLKDGGVMIEGDADVLQSSAKPTVLHGRAGMTIKFVNPDDLSKAVITELEKARLALKPAPAGVPPRPAEVPAEPRAVPPPVGGRIDAANALAECVVIGDVAADAAPKPVTDAGSGKAKFAVPSIPNRSKPTSIGFPLVDKAPAAPARPPVTEDEATAIGLDAPKAPATAPAKAKTPSGGVKAPRDTAIGIPPGRTPFETQPVGTVRPAPPIIPEAGSGTTVGTPPMGPRGKSATRPPLTPRHPTPVAPVPIVRSPAKVAAPIDDAVIARAIEEEEKTDMSEAPAATPAATFAPVDERVDPQASTEVGPPPTQRSGGMRASEIMAAIGTEDWTMTPDAPSPTVLPTPPKAPAGPPTGNWTISLDPEMGWSEPKKVEAPPAPPPPDPAKRARQASSGNPTVSVAGETGQSPVVPKDKPTDTGEAKIEIDSTLMEPVTAMPPLADDVAVAAAPPMSAAMAVPPPPAPLSAGLFAPTPPPMFGDYNATTAAPAAPASRKKLWIALAAVASLGAGFALVLALSGGSSSKPSARVAPTTQPVTKGTTGPGSAAAVVVEPPPKTPEPATPSEPDDSPPTTADTPTEPTDSPEPPDTPSAPPVAATTCKVNVTSTPVGADIYKGTEKLGTTPAALDLPCGVETRVTLRKAKFANTARAFTPVDGKPNKVAVKLVRPTYTMTVTSSPPGATITVGGKSMGVTPAKIKVPAHEASAVTVSKPGYASETKTVTAKANNASLSVALKKKGRR